MSRKRNAPIRPWHWPMWVVVAALRPLVWLPWPVQRGIGRALGRLMFHAVRFRRHVVDVNLRLCFPEMPEAERRRLALRHYEAIGIGFMETWFTWWARSERMPRYEIAGREHLEAAAAEGRGVLLLTAHFTTLEICGRMLIEEKIPLGCLYRDPDDPVIAHLMRSRRKLGMTVSVHMEDLRGLIRALKDGHTIWYAPDQGKRTKMSAVLPFFGVPAMTSMATTRIARMSGARVVPYFGRRLEDGSYQLEILPALENFPGEDPEEDSIRINRLIEENIRLAPEQYFWVHRRFKRRGQGYENVYAR